MSKNKDKNLYDLSEHMMAMASSSNMLVFYQFECPHCKTLNVYSKENKKEVVLCSNKGCRRIIIIKNFNDVA